MIDCVLEIYILACYLHSFHLVISIPPGCSQAMKSLLFNLLKKDPKERLSFGNDYFELSGSLSR